MEEYTDWLVLETCLKYLNNCTFGQSNKQGYIKFIKSRFFFKKELKKPLVMPYIIYIYIFFFFLLQCKLQSVYGLKYKKVEHRRKYSKIRGIDQISSLSAITHYVHLNMRQFSFRVMKITQRCF